MKIKKSIFFAGFILVFFISCASTAHYEEIDAAVFTGDYQGGLDLIKTAKEDGVYSETDAILFYLDAGMLAHYAGDYKESIDYLAMAERSIEAAFTKSVTLEITSYVLNDNVKEYAGEDYEDIYLNVFNALNYYFNGALESSLVEIRRSDNKLKYLATKYGTVTTNAQQAVLAKSTDIPYDPEAVQTNFSNSALARYLGMLFYRAEGKRDDARIDRDQVKLAFANQPNVYTFPLPSSLDDELNVPAGMARLNVISFNGFSPMKQEETVRIPLGGTDYLKITVPILVIRPSDIARTEVVLDTGESFNLELIEDMGAVSTETFKLNAGLIYLKTVLRSLTKTGVSMAFKQTAVEADSAEDMLMLGLIGFGTQVFAEASEQADLRISRYFPSKALVGGINLEPGVYSFTVNYYNKGGRLLHHLRYEDVTVQANRLNLSEAVCIK